MTSGQLKAALGFAIGGAFLFLAVRHVRAAEFVRVLESARIGWLALALLVYWMENWFGLI